MQFVTNAPPSYHSTAYGLNLGISERLIFRLVVKDLAQHFLFLCLFSLG